MKLINKKMANKSIGTSLGLVSFDANGVAEVKGDAKKVESLASIFGATLETATKKAEEPKKVEEPKEEVKEEPVEEKSSEPEEVKEEVKPNFSKMSFKALKEYAKSNNIEIPKDASKNDILAILEK